MSFQRLVEELRDMDGLRSLIARPEPEGLNLDYKAAGGLVKAQVRDQVAKPVSAMANAEGGVVLYGVRTRKLPGDPRDYPDGIDHTDPKLIEQVRNWANEYVVPPIPGLDVRPLSDKATPELAIAVFVPQSPLRPHQVKDDRLYFRRTADSTERMDHSNLELLFRTRIQRELAHQPIVVLNEERGGVVGKEGVSLWLHNVGNAPALNVEVSLDGCVVGKRSALGTDPDHWQLTQRPNDRLQWNQSLARAADKTLPILVRFEDVAGAAYRAEVAMRREISGSNTGLRATGEYKLARER